MEIPGLKRNDLEQRPPGGRPLISVITVVFNAVKCLEKTILSIIGQTYPDIEYVIVDGGSTDGTLDIIRKYESHFDFWTSEPDKGIYDAMNKAIEIINGDWCIFINADDTFFNESVLSAIAPKLRDSETIYYGDIIRDGKTFYGGKFSSFRLSRQNISHQAIFYPGKVILKHKFNLKYTSLADYHLNLILYKSLSFSHLSTTICNCVEKGFSFNNRDPQFNEDRLNLIKENLGFLPYVYKITRSLFHPLKTIHG